MYVYKILYFQIDWIQHNIRHTMHTGYKRRWKVEVIFIFWQYRLNTCKTQEKGLFQFILPFLWCDVFSILLATTQQKWNFKHIANSKKCLQLQVPYFQRKFYFGSIYAEKLFSITFYGGTASELYKLQIKVEPLAHFFNMLFFSRKFQFI